MNVYKSLFFAILSSFVVLHTRAQHTDANVFGDVKSDANNEHIPFVNIYIEGTNIGTTTDQTGHYMMIDLPEGTHVIVAKSLGYLTAKDTVTVRKGQSREINFMLKEETMAINEVVITGTKTFKRQTDSPVIVNILDSKSLDMVQAGNISEGLRFQPGLRVETDCQTCNYTQLRMNGLGGGYSQILINGRPVFSPLTGLYGMEQIPTNMVDRIEVVRGGGSALYGSSAIGGTVNIITRIPQEAAYDFSVSSQNINGKANDVIFTGNINMLTHKRNAGASVFVNRRLREEYDHNGDNFSEMPELKENSFGANIFYKPDQNQKLEVNFTSLNEYRYGGEMVNKAAYLAQQSEERTHNVLMGGLDYQINFNEDKSSFIAYLAGQYTNRIHYTGIVPDEPADIEAHLANPPYGYTDNTTLQVGVQVNHRLREFFSGTNVLTFGTEYVFDDVFDTIPSYNYETDQITKNVGGFAQSDWQIAPNTNLLTGIRIDKHNLVDKVIVSPRVSFLHKVKDYTQIRLTWGTGFRAPQAFDTDMHIAFAGGGVSRISLADNLTHERSNSFSGSVNFDRPTERFIVGFTLESFYTKLNDAFYLHPIGEDEFGQRFEKRNGDGASVQGGTLELRANYNRKVQLEAGVTLQSSLYDKPVENIEGLEAKREFLRAPNEYGYLTLMFTPSQKINASVSSVYTGPMELVHYAGAPGQTIDKYVTSPSFTELNFKLGYTFNLESVDSGLEIFGGVKNLTNAFQDDFDSGKNRDSNYVYGPGAPRTIYIGMRVKSF
ncbi:MAG: TonB-dependent receptor [Prolixibacteraceae bacterium]|jgi:outer membrane receptor for ferrienterochelin and colicins|nr:TonB-dependent receptor [Prolixibacteraceae bacterium]